MTPRRPPRPRASLLVGGLLLLLVAAAAGIALVVRPAVAGVPLDPTIPNGHLLIARGLSGVPDPGQPTTPIAVDRVVTDGTTTYVQFHGAATYVQFHGAATYVQFHGAATYVQFHSTTPRGRVFDMVPQLYDDTGTLVNYGWSAGPASGAGVPPWARLLPPWFPWRPPAGPLRIVATLGPLPSTARAAVLQFGNGETVRVPLNLAALRRVRPYAGPLMQRAGLQLRVVAARDTGLVLGYSPFGEARGVALTDARGHMVALTSHGSGCGGSGFADTGPGLACRAVWTYPPQRRGARLTLTIRSFVAEPNASVSNAVGAGPWHLSVVIP